MLGFVFWELLETLNIRHSGVGRNPVLRIFKYLVGLGPGLRRDDAVFRSSLLEILSPKLSYYAQPNMPSLDQGFLSEPFDEIKEAIRTRYARWRNLLLCVNRGAVELQHSISIDPKVNGQVLAAVLFARTLASTQGAVILLEYGLLSQSKTLLRMALETFFELGAISVRPDLVPILIESQEADRRTVADRMLRWQDPGLREEVAKHISADELESFKKSTAKAKRVYDLAVAAGMEDWYLSLYSLLSFPAHGALSDLANHIVVDGKGGIEALKNEPEINEQEASWSYAIEIQIKSIEKFASFMGLSSVNVNSYREDLRELIKQNEKHEQNALNNSVMGGKC